jgi:hypothetical protein
MHVTTKKSFQIKIHTVFFRLNSTYDATYQFKKNKVLTLKRVYSICLHINFSHDFFSHVLTLLDLIDQKECLIKF